MSTDDKTIARYIVRNPGILGGIPIIAGRRIGVQHIVIWHNQQSRTPHDIAKDFDLNPASVYAALAYYYDHQEEIDADIQENIESFEIGWQTQQSDPFYQKLRAKMEALHPQLEAKRAVLRRVEKGSGIEISAV